MNRRDFLGGLALIGCQGLAIKATHPFMISPAIKAEKKSNKKFDDNLVVFISDLHTNPDGYQPDLLVRTINDILKMRPLPRNVIALGDLAYLTGETREYELLKKIIRPLEESGITLTMAMGNHDRRPRYREAFPERANASLMKNRFVYIVETPRADFIILDSLHQDADLGKTIVPGELNEEQKVWLHDTLMAYKKPVFVCAHHAWSELGLNKILLESPTCCGYIHGHDHVWRPGWFKQNYKIDNMIRTLCLPSTGHWGDIGYMNFKLGEDKAIAELKQYEYFFPKPKKNPADKPMQWKLIEDDHKGLVCQFAYNRPK